MCAQLCLVNVLVNWSIANFVLSVNVLLDKVVYALHPVVKCSTMMKSVYLIILMLS